MSQHRLRQSIGLLKPLLVSNEKSSGLQRNR